MNPREEAWAVVLNTDPGSDNPAVRAGREEAWQLILATDPGGDDGR